MPYNTFGPALVKGRQGPLPGRTGRVYDYAGVEQLATFTTGNDPQPTPLVSDSDGYINQFSVSSDHRLVWVDIDGRRKLMVAHEALEAVNPQIQFSVDPANPDLGIVSFPAFILSPDQTSITVPIGS